MGFLCVALVALGHWHRDGGFDWKTHLSGFLGTRWEWLWHLSTQLARACGAALCGLGALALYGWRWPALAAWLGVWVGFYTDSQHAKGQGAHTLADAGWLAVSGATSLLPLAVGLGLAERSWLPALLVPGFAMVKPALWFLARWTVAGRYRVAATSFGGCIGLALVLLTAC